MAKYHVNPDTGDTGLCSATHGNCPFGGDEAHYTSAEAARESYESRFTVFPSTLRRTVDIDELYSRALTKLPVEKVTEQLIAEANPGTFFMKIHYESSDRSYLVKTDEGLIKPFYRDKGSGKIRFGAMVKTGEMLTRGSSGYFIAGSQFESDYNSHQLFSAFKDPACAERTAKLYYEEHMKRGGFIGLAFDEIAESEKSVRVELAKKAIEKIYFSGGDSTKEQMAQELQRERGDYLSGSIYQERIDNKLLLETAARVIAEQPLRSKK